ncbi:YggT family protein [Streptococcus chenjunshii]|uniref:YggT family protein n=1 Tax=Streptococcus chenjunshii TaxID=2173853 RepID=A0A372KPG3_9STRE|nr:YggT family protein [Streptococcus chenjunshii]AXQ79710.1 YggT family protein [Streptococcus chenjunshii]RFU50956.1 YggT family protein [Streptococcus chenjunshii]RFU53488.1 YggT family protein [Streptococcus chenjunshii]
MIFLISVLIRLIRVYSYILVAYALLSWFPGAYDTWLGRLLRQLSEPFLKPFRQLNLQFAGLDFTVWVAVIGLNLISQLVQSLAVMLFIP